MPLPCCFVDSGCLGYKTASGCARGRSGRLLTGRAPSEHRGHDGRWPAPPGTEISERRGEQPSYAGLMASSWTRIHQELNLPPGPLTFGMIERATKEIDGERDDLDWKRALPKKPEAGLWSEFAKDVAAMANARGGLLVYGVRNDRAIEGVNPQDAPTEHLYKWLRAHTQPFVGGVDIFPLQCPDMTKSVLVVDVPASAMAPHFVLGTSSRDKDQQAFAAPARR